MEIPVLVEPVSGSKQRYRAQAGQPWSASAEAATAEEAVKHVQDIVRAKLSAGARMMMIQIDNKTNPWISIAGSLPAGASTDAWEKAMQEYRDEVNLQEKVS